MSWLRSLMLCAITIVTVSLASPADAACRLTWDCTGGQCKQTQLCDPALPPMGSPATTPSTRPAMQPPGTTSCAPSYLCTPSGQCAWRTACQ
jgi:hypothetical protein